MLGFEEKHFFKSSGYKEVLANNRMIQQPAGQGPAS
jgi:hypothetical protein